MDQELLFQFEGETPADAGRYAADLAETLALTAPHLETRRVRSDPDAMDFGATLAIVLGAPAIVALAKGVADWIRRNRGATVTVKGQNGEITLTNVSGADARAIAERFALIMEG